MVRIRLSISWLLAAILIGPAAVHAQTETEAVDPEAVFFGNTIVPLLAAHCLECHGPRSSAGGLDLSSPDSLRAGGESGAVIVPGKESESLLWQAVEAGEMPKDRPPLSEQERLALKKWIHDGGIWSGGEIDPLEYSTEARAGYDWWSLQPVRRPELPQVRQNSWVRNTIDRFVLARLEASGLQPAPATDRRELIRRVYFDLIGLPPTPEAVSAFETSQDPLAYEKLVDELLDSKHYGERWARHWLDVVRFGETQGFERNLIRDHAWRYRDWVIQAWNDDLSYDEFIRLQVAGDVLRPNDYDAVIATGFHVCGTWDQVGHLEGSPVMQVAARWDHLEDLVATVGQSFLGLTVNCARCHDHKYDPISQQDYYQMVALLAGVNQRQEEPDLHLTRDGPTEARLSREQQEVRARVAQLGQALRAKYPPSGDRQPVEGLQVLYEFEPTNHERLVDRSEALPSIDLVAGQMPRWSSAEPPARLIDAMKASGEMTVEAWIQAENDRQSGPARIVTLSRDSGQRNFTLGQDGSAFDFRLRTSKTDANGLPSLSTPTGVVTTRMTHVVVTFTKDGRSRIYVDGKLSSERELGGDFSNWDNGFRLGLGDEQSGGRTWQGDYGLVALYSRALDASEVARHFETRSAGIRAVETLEEIVARATEEERAEFGRLAERQREIEAELSRVSFFGRAHVVVSQQPPAVHLLARGNPQSPGDEVAPKGLQALVAAGLSEDLGLASTTSDRERRLKLAQWLTDPQNPLTARVLVNRLWHYHFGHGIVDTPSDFGFSGGRPSHPELLDHLASQLVEGGWRIKELQRSIVTSATYRQQSRVDNDSARSIDSDNRLLWHYPARKLEGEVVRDSVLFVAGVLNPQLGGPSFRDVTVKLATNHEFTTPTNEFSPETCRRTIYRLWARSGNHPMLAALDCPDPSVMMPRRPGTITPIQAFSLLNNPFMNGCAEAFAARVQAEADGALQPGIDRAFQLALQRSPTSTEAELAQSFVQVHGWKQFCLVLFNTNEFVFAN